MAAPNTGNCEELKFETREVKYEWRINDFTTNRPFMKYKVNSPAFKGEDLPQWYIELYPRGQRAVEKETFGVFLAREKAENGEKSVVVDFNLDFLDDNDRVMYRANGPGRMFDEGCAWGHSIVSDSNKPIPLSASGKLIIRVTIFIRKLVQTDPYQFAIEIPKSSAHQDWTKLLKSGDYADFIIESADGKVFPVHKNVLSTRNPQFFGLMFKTPMKEVVVNRVKLPFEGEIISALLEYVYTDEVVNLTPIATRLYTVASQYKLDRLMLICTDCLCQHLTVNNISVALRIAKQFEDVKLLSACLKFIDEHKDAAVQMVLDAALIDDLATSLDMAAPNTVNCGELKFEASEISHEWTIPDFTTRLPFMPDKVNSHMFQGEDLPRWFLRVYPRGDAVDNEKFGVFLFLVTAGNGQKTLMADCILKFFDDDGTEIRGKNLLGTEFEETKGCGFAIKNDSADPIPLSTSGKLIIRVNITIRRQVQSDPFHFPIEIPKSSALEDWTKLLKSGDYADFIVESVDGQVFPVHKNVLSTRNPYFFAVVFISAIKEARESRVELPFEGEIVASLLEYVYTDAVVNLTPIATQLYAVAHQYGLDRLVVICAANISQNLTVANISVAIRIAKLFEDVKLMSACQKFIDEHKNVAAQMVLDAAFIDDLDSDPTEMFIDDHQSDGVQMVSAAAFNGDSDPKSDGNEPIIDDPKSDGSWLCCLGRIRNWF